jgi:ATP-binding cassette subfamily B protein
VVAAGAIKGVLMLFRRWLAGRLSLAVEYDLRNAMYAHLQRLSFGFFDTHQTGQLMSRATVDLQSVRFFLGYGLIFFTQNLITITIVAIALVVIDWQLALIAFAVAPLLSRAAFRYSRASHPVLKEVQQRVADVTTQAEENIVGVRVVKAFAQEPRQLRSFADGTERIFDQAILAARLQATYVPFMSSLPNLAMAAVVLAGGYRVVHGDLSLGSFFAVNGYLLLLVVPLRSIGMWVGQYQRAIASGERIFEVLDYDRDILDRRDAETLRPGPGGIRMSAVRFGYDPDRPVLHDIDLDVAAGSTVALIGPTGCGKTTLTTLIPRFYDVQAGTIELDGQDVQGVTLRSLRAAVGIVSQDTFLFSTTVAENIAFGTPEATPEQIVVAARQAQAHEFICDLPDGYETVVGERGLSLSGGQRQRIAIARALLMNPRVLILDDATASVDASTEARIKLALREVMKGRTTVIIAHRLSTISLADEVVVLDKGRIVARGTHDELVQTSPVYREIHDHGLVERRFVQLDPDGAPIEKDGEAPARRASGGRLP